jgi:hypothetical protein
MLPDGLVPSTVQPSGESRGETAAYHQAVVRALATIRECRAVELVATSFAAIPHDALMDEPVMDHDVLVKKSRSLQPDFLIGIERWWDHCITPTRSLLKTRPRC